MDTMKQTVDDEKAAYWISQIHHNTESFKNEFLPCSPEQLIFKPSAETWSIAENIQHVMVVNKSYFPIFSALITNTYRPSWSSRFSFLNRLLGNVILKSVSEDRKKKIKTFPLWVPENFAAPDDTLSRFESHQKELIDWIQKLQPFIGNATVINSPANKIISYTLDDAIDIIIMHEKRHLNQAIEVKQNLI